MKSFHEATAAKIATVVSAGSEVGNAMVHRIRHSLAPSTRAASSIARGICSMNWRSRNT